MPTRINMLAAAAGKLNAVSSTAEAFIPDEMELSQANTVDSNSDSDTDNLITVTEMDESSDEESPSAIITSGTHIGTYYPLDIRPPVVLLLVDYTYW